MSRAQPDVGAPLLPLKDCLQVQFFQELVVGPQCARLEGVSFVMIF